MLNENLVILAGRLGEKPILKRTESRINVTTFSLATHKHWLDEFTGENQEKTIWVNCVAFGKIAEMIAEHFDKRSPIYLRGEISENAWEDSEGKKKSRMEIKVNSFKFIENKSKEEE